MNCWSTATMEASVFNGREPDETRTDFDFAALDSTFGRFWFLPSHNWAFRYLQENSRRQKRETTAAHESTSHA